jgi:hypothetical protein
MGVHVNDTSLFDQTIPFHVVWTPQTAASYLTDQEPDQLARRIQEAIFAGKIHADAREVPYRRTLHDNVFKIRYGGVDPKELPATETEYRMKPIDAIRWAIAAGIDVRPECLSRYHELTKPKKRATRSGPREATLYAVIAAMAKTLGYTPGKSLKAGQGKLKAIMVNTNLTEKTIREVIEQALHHHEDK